VPIAGIQEQLGALHCLVELPGRVEVSLESPLVGFHQVDVERDALRPGATELRGRDAAVEQQRSLGTRPRLGQHLRRPRPEREPGIDDLARQAFGREPTALPDGVEADLAGVADTVVDVGEGVPVVEIRGVDDMSGSAELVREGENAGRQWKSRTSAMLPCNYLASDQFLERGLVADGIEV
jgi:hypothetical protein